MAEITIIMMDEDEGYLLPLERKFLDELGEEARIHVITDMTYAREYFAEPRNADILIIHEQLYGEGFERHNIRNIYLLSEEEAEKSASSTGIHRIYKYTSVKEIYGEIMSSARLDMSGGSRAKETQLLMVYSPIGGIGKTTVAVGLGATLTRNYKKVLFVSMDDLQSFGYLLKDRTPMPETVENKITADNEYIYNEVRGYIRNEIFDYLPPFRLALSSLNINVGDYLYLIEAVKNTNIYDYIVIDSNAGGFASDIEVMSKADKVILLAGQDEYAAHKLKCFLDNVDISQGNKFCCVCNKYEEEANNYLVEPQYSGMCHITEYLQKTEEITVGDILSLAENGDIQRIAMMYV